MWQHIRNIGHVKLLTGVFHFFMKLSIKENILVVVDLSSLINKIN